jgi:hypothetical protein
MLLNYRFKPTRLILILFCCAGVKNHQFHWCAGAMDNFYLDKNEFYKALSYDVLHKFLARDMRLSWQSDNLRQG